MSIETEQHRRLKNKIYSDLNVKSFSINNWEKLTEIPQEINLLQQLERLSIYRNKSIKIYPQELADLPNLRHISLRFNNLKQIPKVLGELNQLKTLTLSNNRFFAAAKWNLLTKMSALEELDFSYSLQNLSSLPPDIGKIKALRVLNISGNKLQFLPESLKQLKFLEKLYCEGNDFEGFPIVLTQIPNLRVLRISAKSLKDLPDEVLDLQHIPDLEFSAKSNKTTPYIYHLERLLFNIKKYNFSKEESLFYLAVIRGSFAIKDLNNKQLLSLLNCAISEFSNAALAELSERINDHQFGTFKWPTKGDKIVIKGKLKGKVSELKSRLQQNDILTGVKVNKATTHILVGSMPQQIYDFTQDYPINLITEQLLVAYLNQLEQPYLLSTPEASNLTNIRQLLHSDQPENTLMALEILKGGGFPMEMLTELFLIYKFSRVQKIKRIIHQIIGQYAPLEFVTALKSRKAIGRMISESTRCRNLEYYCELGNLDKKYIAYYLLEKGNYGLLFALFNLETKDKKNYFSKAIQKGSLTLSNLELNELPDDMGQIPGLFTLDISYNKFTKVPPPLFECQELHTIFIRGLYDLHKKPQDLWLIPNLKNIYIGYNNKWINFTNTNLVLVDGKKIIGR